MAGHTTMKRDGGWTVELLNPVEGIDKLDIRPPTLRHTVRWGNGEIPSVLAFLSELTGVREAVLQELTGADSDRVLMALSFISPAQIKDDFNKGAKPLATPTEAMTDAQRYEAMDQNDPIDPRFPKVQGDVQRFKQPEQAETSTDEKGGMDVSPPDVMRKVG